MEAYENRRKVLVMDPDSFALSRLTDHMIQDGYEVYAAEDVRTMVEAMKNIRGDELMAVIIGVDMMDSELHELPSLVRSAGKIKYRKLPIFYLAEAELIDQLASNQELDVDGFLKRPFDKKDFKALIRNIK